MKYLWLTDVEPLRLLLDFDINGINIDLHNDFECVNINNENKRIEFHFRRLMGNEFYKEQNVVLIFSNVLECNIELLTAHNKVGDLSTLFNFAKGDLTDANQYFHDKSIKYFFIGFMNGDLIDIFCKEAIIFLW